MVGAGATLRSLSLSKAGGHTSTRNRLNIGGRYLRSPFHNFRNSFISNFFLNNLLCHLLFILEGDNRYHLSVSCRGFLQCLFLCGIPIVIIDIDNFCLIIFLIVHLFLTYHCKLRAGYCNDKFVSRSDHGVFILKSIIHFNQFVHRNIGLNCNLRKRVTGNYLVHIALFLILRYFPDRFINLCQLLLAKVGFNHFDFIAILHRDQTQIIILEIHFTGRFNLFKCSRHFSVNSGLQTDDFHFLLCTCCFLLGKNLSCENIEFS